MPAHSSECPPETVESLAAWIVSRLQEPSAEWSIASEVAADLPWPVNLPGMHKAVAALVARYRSMPADWLADVLQDFMVWLLREQTPHTIARSARTGVSRGVVASLEAGIAWKLRAELLSQAHRAYARRKVLEERLRDARRLAARMVPLVREAAAERFTAATGL